MEVETDNSNTKSTTATTARIETTTMERTESDDTTGIKIKNRWNYNMYLYKESIAILSSKLMMPFLQQQVHHSILPYIVAHLISSFSYWECIFHK